MPYIFVRCQISHLDGFEPFNSSTWQHHNITYIDFQQNDALEDRIPTVIRENLFGGRHDYNRADDNKPYYQTYKCNYPPHVVFNELEIHAGYKVIAANTTTETFVWTLHKPWSYITAERQQ